MGTPLQSIRERIIALVKREVAVSISAENIGDIRQIGKIALESIDDIRQALSEVIRPDLEAQSALIESVIQRLNDIDSRLQANEFLSVNIIDRLNQISGDLDTLKSRVRAEPFRSVPIEIVSSLDGSTTLGFDTAGQATYVDFVDMFRPSFEALYSEISHFSKWFPRSGPAVDLGAGRGEMVKVMTDYGLKSFGIDSDISVVGAARERGIDVRQSDIDDFLDSADLKKYDLVSAIQVVEHVDTKQLEAWFKRVKAILKDGGVFLIETPNPHAIDAFKAFWIDVTHVRPYYPESLLYMAQSVGFSRAEIWAAGTQDDVVDRLEFAGSYVLVATA